MNIAARIQGPNKAFDTDIIGSDAERQGLDRCIDMNPLPPLTVTGIRGPLQLSNIDKQSQTGGVVGG